MKYIYMSLLVLAGSPVWASVYATADAADEGIRRGISEPFTRGVGCLGVVAKEGVFQGNAILISRNTILTNAHLLTGKTLESVSVRFYADIAEYDAHFPKAVEAGLDPCAIPFKGVHMDPKHPKTIFDIGAMIDLSTIVVHPHGLDFAIARLKSELPDVPRLPLMLTRPEEICSGYLVSYSPVSVLGEDKVKTTSRRHISIVRPKERKKTVEAKDAGPVLWMKEWDMPEGVGVASAASKVFIPKADDHRLTAYPQSSDSGSPFVLKVGKDYVIGGIYGARGFIIAETSGGAGTEAAAVGGGAGGAASKATAVGGAGTEDTEKTKAYSIITPIYVAADWIEAHI